MQGEQRYSEAGTIPPRSKRRSVAWIADLLILAIPDIGTCRRPCSGLDGPGVHLRPGLRQQAAFPKTGRYIGRRAMLSMTVGTGRRDPTRTTYGGDRPSCGRSHFSRAYVGFSVPGPGLQAWKRACAFRRGGRARRPTPTGLGGRPGRSMRSRRCRSTAWRSGGGWPHQADAPAHSPFMRHRHWRWIDLIGSSGFA